DVFLLLYVDDCLIGSTNPTRLNQIKAEIAARLEVRDLGEVCQFNGLHIERDPNHGHFIVSQEAHIKECLKQFNLTDAKTVSRLPAVETLQYDGPELNSVQKQHYQSLIGSLMYISTVSRP